MNVKRNMLKEQEMDGKGEGEENYHTKEQQKNNAAGNGKDKLGGNNTGNGKQAEGKEGDINLTDRNVVLNFGEEGEEDSNAQQVQNEVAGKGSQQ